MTKQFITFDQVVGPANVNLTTKFGTVYDAANLGSNTVDVRANSGVRATAQTLNFINTSSVTVNVTPVGDGNVNVGFTTTVPGVIIQVACSDLVSNLQATYTLPANVAYFRSPRAFTMTDVRASLGNASVGNAAFTQGDANSCNIQIFMNGTARLTAGGLRMNQNANTSVGANIAYTIANGAFTDDGLVAIQLANVGNAANGLIVTIIGS